MSAEEWRASRALEAAAPGLEAELAPGLAVGVVGRDGLVASRFVGFANLEHEVPVAESTIFYVASASKQFTAASLFLAADSNQLSLTDPVRRYMPELPTWADDVRVVHLISHSAGLPEYGDLVPAAGLSIDAPLTDATIVALLAEQHELAFPPGAQCKYSNTAYWLLGLLLAHTTGVSLRSFSTRHLFDPLGMRHTCYRDDRWEIIPGLADGYMPADDGYQHWRTCFDRVGDGGVVTDLMDLARWESCMLSNGSAASEIASRLVAPRPLDDGSVPAWRAGVVVDTHRHHVTVMAGGTGFGYRAFSVRVPASGVSVIALSNLGTADVRSAAFRVLDQILGST